MRGRRWGAALAAVAIVAAAAVVVVVRHVTAPAWPDDGPLVVPPTHGYTVRYGVGQVFTDGFERLKLAGDQPGVLRSVELIGPSTDHFQVVGVLIAGPHRELGAWEQAPGFPPHYRARDLRRLRLGPHPLGQLVPAIGATLPTGRVGSALQIGLKVVKPGLAIRTGVRVRYTVGDRQYSAVLPGSIANCPQGMTITQCQQAYLALE